MADVVPAQNDTDWLCELAAFCILHFRCALKIWATVNMGWFETFWRGVRPVVSWLKYSTLGSGGKQSPKIFAIAWAYAWCNKR